MQSLYRIIRAVVKPMIERFAAALLSDLLPWKFSAVNKKEQPLPPSSRSLSTVNT